MLSTGHKAWLSLGSNLPKRREHLARAVSSLRKHFHLNALSSIWESPPIGHIKQGNFLNAALTFQSPHSPQDTLAILLKIERENGRERGTPWGPRRIDLDLLLFDNRTIEEDGLSLPHPEMTQRIFVLKPLEEIDAKLLLKGKNLKHWIKACPAPTIRQVATFPPPSLTPLPPYTK